VVHVNPAINQSNEDTLMKKTQNGHLVLPSKLRKLSTDASFIGDRLIIPILQKRGREGNPSRKLT
jgi:hypothetical protein